MSEAVGVGLIGCGHVAASRHLPALSMLPDVRVVALADVDHHRLESLGSRYGVSHRYAAATALLEDPSVEVVGVLVPAAGRTEVLLSTLEAGKPALVEKPLALGAADCERAIERAGQTTATVAVGFNLRAHRLVRRAQELLAGGLVGPIEAITGTIGGGVEDPDNTHWRGWRFDRRLGGGALFEKGPHHFDLWRLFTGSEVAEVTAMSSNAEGTDRTAVVCARTESGVLATTALADYGSAVNRVTVFGPRGRLELSMLEFDGLRFTPASTYPGDARGRLRGLRESLRELPRGLRVMREGGEYVASYRREWELFLGAVRGDRPIFCTLEDGRRAVQVALAAVASSVEGRTMTAAGAPPDLESALARSVDRR